LLGTPLNVPAKSESPRTVIRTRGLRSADRVVRPTKWTRRTGARRWHRRPQERWSKPPLPHGAYCPARRAHHKLVATVAVVLARPHPQRQGRARNKLVVAEPPSRGHASAYTWPPLRALASGLAANPGLGALFRGPRRGATGSFESPDRLTGSDQQIARAARPPSQPMFVYPLLLSDADDHVVSLTVTLSRKTNPAAPPGSAHAATGFPGLSVPSSNTSARLVIVPA
jgi:hypothetical protein